MTEHERLTQFIDKLKGRPMVASPSDGRVIVVGDLGGPYGDNGTMADNFGIPPAEAKALLERHGDTITWIEVPVLRISTDSPGLEGMPLNVAPIVYYHWVYGDGHFVDEICAVAHAEDGEWHGIASGLAFPFTRSNGELPDFDKDCNLELNGGGASKSAFDDWVKASLKSADEDVRAFGRTIKESHAYFKNRSLDGEWLGEGPNPEGMEEDDEDDIPSSFAP